MFSGAAMLTEEVQPLDPVRSDKNDETKPKDSPQKDPDKTRGEVFRNVPDETFGTVMRKGGTYDGARAV